VNRGIFEFNRHLDSFVLKPVATAYNTWIPGFFRERVHSMLVNLRAPVILANDLLQGEGERAGITVARFLVNSTLGFAGMFDMAAEMGLEHHDEDFGQTLAVWGLGEGPYLVIPLLGPSNLRDGAGRVVDLFLDPFNYLVDDEYIYARSGVALLDARARHSGLIEDLEATSIDLYATYRTLYRQHRGDEIRNGDLPPPAYLPDMTLDELEDLEPAAGSPAQDEMGELTVGMITDVFAAQSADPILEGRSAGEREIPSPLESLPSVLQSINVGLDD
ncbi:MAG: VacJ family lipoprotein, partial [Alphaproteobacteria bacterium]